MKLLTDHSRARTLLEKMNVEETYPQSIYEGVQRGELYADDAENPRCLLAWHYCGFANLAGEISDETAEWLLRMMHNPPEGHSGRMALQIEEEPRLDRILTADTEVRRGERYIFELANADVSVPRLPEGFELCPIDAENYDLLCGRIIPTFSWESKEAFLERGYGVCIVRDGAAAACAFSSAVSSKQTDIGVETMPDFRGMGLAKTAAIAMIRETVRRGKKPVWNCDVRNEASKRTALSAGFRVADTHPWYII